MIIVKGVTMKTIEVEDDLYRYIASQTEDIGESASAILRRLLGLPVVGEICVEPPIKAPEAVRSAAKVTKKAETVKSEPVKVVVSKKVANEHSDYSLLIAPENIEQQKAAVGRFLFLLDRLHDMAPSQFAKVLDISGRDRVYFAVDKQSLLGKNGSTKPKQIGESPYWVITNSNTGKKRSMLTNVLTSLGCDSDIAERIAEQI